MTQSDKIVITGAAGLLGQNLILVLKESGYSNLVAIDKNTNNLKMLQKLHPTVKLIEADLAVTGPWQEAFEGAREVLILHAQITGLEAHEFERNNLTATQHVLEAVHRYRVPHAIHISSSVVNSVIQDAYTETKKAQEKMVQESGIACCILRPTLMFGWFDPKHLGWLSRFMAKVPVFPIPGNGKYIRQPLYSRDFCRVIVAAMEQCRVGEVHDIVGLEEITYIDMIRLIKRLTKARAWILPIPYGLFYSLLKVFALICKKPPFTASQLKALTAGDYFKGVDFEREFGVKSTPLTQAFTETFTDPRYSHIALERT